MKPIICVLILCLSVYSYAAKNSKGAAKKDEDAIRTLATAMVTSWNAHDAKQMAALWSSDGTLINPMGRVANGRKAVEQLFSEEHSTMLKQSTATLSVLAVQWIKPDVAVVDHEMNVTGILNREGTPAPDMNFHVVTTEVKAGGKWWIASCRPYAFLPKTEPRDNASTKEN